MTTERNGSSQTSWPWASTPTLWPTVSRVSTEIGPWQSDNRRRTLSRIGRFALQYVGLPSEPGRCFRQDLALDFELANAAAKPNDLFVVSRGHAVATNSRVEVVLFEPIPNRLDTGSELDGQIISSAACAGKIEDLTSKLGRIRPRVLLRALTERHSRDRTADRSQSIGLCASNSQKSCKPALRVRGLRCAQGDGHGCYRRREPGALSVKLRQY